jgi:hypothetical protein
MPDPLRTQIGSETVPPHHVIDKVIETLWAAEVADHQLRTGAVTNKVERDLMLIGLLVSLGNFVEGVAVLRDMDKALFGQVYDFHKDAFEVWKGMRHDVSHHLERAFRVNPKRDPTTIKDQSEWLVIALNDISDPSKPIPRTGVTNSISMPRLRPRTR